MAVIPSNTPYASNEAQPEFALQRVFAEVSSEIPGAPESFDLTESPSLDMQLNIQSKKSEKFDNTYSVVLTVTVKATLPETDNKVLFLIEVKQGGLFTARGFDDASLETFLSIHCPTLLYPYACVHITDLVARGGFMPLHLPPVDFNSMYAQHQANAEKESN
jgi:preprotein translocase subunit SecB